MHTSMLLAAIAGLVASFDSVAREKRRIYHAAQDNLAKKSAKVFTPFRGFLEEHGCRIENVYGVRNKAAFRVDSECLITKAAWQHILNLTTSCKRQEENEKLALLELNQAGRKFYQENEKLFQALQAEFEKEEELLDCVASLHHFQEGLITLDECFGGILSCLDSQKLDSLDICM